MEKQKKNNKKEKKKGKKKNKKRKKKGKKKKKRRRKTYFEEFEKVVKLAVNVSADSHWTPHWLYIRLFHKDFLGL